MPRTSVTETEFASMVEEYGIAGTAKRLGISDRNAFRRRATLEAKLGKPIKTPDRNRDRLLAEKHPQRIILDIPNGIVLVGSDGHYWPGEASVAHRAFVAFTKKLKPAAVIANGDCFDGASISRYPPIGWASQPTVQQEIEACQDRLDEIAKAIPKGCRLIWSLGNHDARFETRIAQVAPEFAKVAGTSLRDHFPLWEPCWSTWINDNTVIKHRFKGGMHAPQNNTLWAGMHMVTGHLHSAKVQPITDYKGTRFGVDTGCLADTFGEPFRDYTEDNPRNWRSGFAVLTYRDRQLMWPELVVAVDETRVQFRGELIEV